MKSTKRRSLFLLLSFLTIGVVTTIVLVATILSRTNVSVTSLRTVDSSSAAEQLVSTQTQEFRALAKSMGATGAGDPPKLRTLAEQRRKSLLDLIAIDPKQAQSYLLTPEEINALPADVQEVSEKRIKASGRFYIIAVDHFEEKRMEHLAYVETEGKSYRLIVPMEKMHELQSQSTVQIEATQIDSVIMAYGAADTLAVTTLASNPTAIGTRKLAVIRFNFINDTSINWNTQDLKRMIFSLDPNTVNGYFKENSYSKLTFAGHYYPDGDMYGVYTLPIQNDCGTTQSTYGTYMDDWARRVDLLAAPDGFNAANYDNIMYFSPQIQGKDCYAQFAGELGGKRTWIAGDGQGYTFIDYDLLAHELGHNLGMQHSNSLKCYDANNVRVAMSANCTSVEYGDTYDAMGAGEGHFNNYQKNRLGWLSSTNISTLSTTVGETTRTLYPIEKTSGVTMVVVPIASSQAYVVEYRQPYGYDKFPPPGFTQLIPGVIIRKTANSYYTSPMVVDTTPQTESYDDNNLGVGKSFYDSANNITITTVSDSGSSANVKIVRGTVVASPSPTPPPAPAVVITPNGGESWAVGSTQTITWQYNPQRGDLTEYPIDTVLGFYTWNSDGSYTKRQEIAATTNVKGNNSKSVVVPALASGTAYVVKVTINVYTEDGSAVYTDYSNARFSITGTTSTKPPNLISNGSFEKDTNGDTRPDSWSTNSHVTRSNVLVEKDLFSMLHSSSSSTSYTITQNIPSLSAGKPYYISGHVNMPAYTSGLSFKIAISWLNSSGSTIRKDTVKTYTAKTTGWNKFLKDMTSPSNTTSAQVRMEVSGLATKVYVDDFTFELH